MGSELDASRQLRGARGGCENMNLTHTALRITTTSVPISRGVSDMDTTRQEQSAERS